MIITSLKNEKIKEAASLRERKNRDTTGKALIEGFRACTRALGAGMEITDLYFCPELFLGENEQHLIDEISAQGAATYQTAPQVLAKIAYRDRPEGLVGVIRTRKHVLAGIPAGENGTYLVVESIEKPGNLGSMLRSADAAGAAGVIVCGKCTDIYNPNVITASTGTVFTVPLAEAGQEETLEWLKTHRIKSVATSPHAEKTYCDEDLTGPVAIVAGSEQYGLSEFWMGNADAAVKIPMLGTADSLNVATSTTILLYEAARQKHWNHTA